MNSPAASRAARPALMSEVASSLARLGGGVFGGAGDRPQPVHDHRALPSRARGRALCRQDLAERRGDLQRELLSIEGAARPRARPCSRCCCRLRRRAPIPRFAGWQPPRCSNANRFRFPTSAAPRAPATSRLRNNTAVTRFPMCARAVSACTAAASSASWWRDLC